MPAMCCKPLRVLMARSFDFRTSIQSGRLLLTYDSDHMNSLSLMNQLLRCSVVCFALLSAAASVCAQAVPMLRVRIVLELNERAD